MTFVSQLRLARNRKSIVNALATRLNKMNSIATNSHSKSLRSYSHLKFYTKFPYKSESTYDILRLLFLCSFPRLWFKPHKTAIRRNATAPIVETMCYFVRKIGLPDFGIASFRVGINLDLTTTICYSMHTAVCNSSFSLETISSTAELFIKDHAKSRITRPVWWERRNVKILSTYVY